MSIPWGAKINTTKKGYYKMPLLKPQAAYKQSFTLYGGSLYFCPTYEDTLKIMRNWIFTGSQDNFQKGLLYERKTFTKAFDEHFINCVSRTAMMVFDLQNDTSCDTASISRRRILDVAYWNMIYYVAKNPKTTFLDVYNEAKNIGMPYAPISNHLKNEEAITSNMGKIHYRAGRQQEPLSKVWHDELQAFYTSVQNLELKQALKLAWHLEDLKDTPT